MALIVLYQEYGHGRTSSLRIRHVRSDGIPLADEIGEFEWKILLFQAYLVEKPNPSLVE